MKFACFSHIFLFLLTLSVQGQTTHDLVASLDGVLSPAERAAATDSLRESNSALFVRTDGDLLWIALQSDSIGVASLCLGAENEVRVLHASAALGMLTYTRQETDWMTDRGFTWALRDASMTEAAIAERQTHLIEHGWVATTSSMGHPNHSEFLIRQNMLPEDDLYLAVGIMPLQHPAEILGLPSAGAGDCARGDLVRGPAPRSGLRFEPASWKKILQGSP